MTMPVDYSRDTVGTGDPHVPGTVRVTVDVGQPPGEAWAALTDPARLRQWFGTPDRALAPGDPVRVEFGDGDFFLLRIERLDPGRLVEFEWQFLGIGPVDRIRWEVTPAPAGSTVTVVDSEPSRDLNAVRVITEGWQDFLGRLRLYLGTGRNARYDWRGEIDGAVDVAGGVDPLRDLDRIYRWLPVASDGFEPHWFFVVDDEGPRRFEIADWRLLTGRLTFGVRVPEASVPTRCVVRTEPVADGRRMSFQHMGWRDLGLDDDVARRLRTRFAATWVAALEAAQALTAGSLTGESR
jgi:uncharacterized protein YndB with AHSA1/START domain